MDPPPILRIIGAKVALGPLTRRLLTLHLRWINDFATMRTYRIPRLYNTEASISKWDTLGTTERQISFAVYEYHSLRPVVRTGLTDLDIRSQCAECDLVSGEHAVRFRTF